MSTLLTRMGIDQLSRDERLQLVDEILESLDESATPDLSENQRAELDRRVAALDADPSRAVPWEDVKERIRARLRR